MNNEALTLQTPGIVLNVKVYGLAFSGAPEYDSHLDIDEINELFYTVNFIWECARIRWKLLSYQNRFIAPDMASGMATISGKQDLRLLFRQIIPAMPAVLLTRIWKVCLLNRFPVRSYGIYLPETKTVFLAESSRQYKLNAATLAHELGHMLGLQHVSAAENIMNPYALREIQAMIHSPPGIIAPPLDEHQIEQARAQAETGPY